MTVSDGKPVEGSPYAADTGHQVRERHGQSRSGGRKVVCDCNEEWEKLVTPAVETAWKYFLP